MVLVHPDWRWCAKQLRYDIYLEILISSDDNSSWKTVWAKPNHSDKFNNNFGQTSYFLKDFGCVKAGDHENFNK